MKVHHIDFTTLQPTGAVSMDLSDGLLRFTTTRRLSNNFEKEGLPMNAYICLPGTYHLPFRIDIRLALDAPGFFICLGDGHVTFATAWSDNRLLGDLLQPDRKPRMFYNHLPLKETVDVQISCFLNAMQIMVNGEERFFSRKERYMKDKALRERNEAGFTIKLACVKRTNVVVQDLRVTEYEGPIELLDSGKEIPEPISGNAAIAKGSKPEFEACLSRLPEEIRLQVLETDRFLRTLHPMKFKRQLEKYGNKITWVDSEHGFSYAVHPSGDLMTHSLSWYIITSGKPETWHRKADHMEEALRRTAETDSSLAGRLFDNLTECIGCCRPCIVGTVYTFNSLKKVTCHGRMEFTQKISDLEDARAFIKVINGMDDTGVSSK